jgi:NAD(P)-dependent dehydrogenase (short-subunit alcohol dehydrogenase family)
LAGAGVNVALHYHRSAEAAVSTAAEIRELGVEVRQLQADLSDVAAVERVVDEAATTWGRLDILVNNAAIFKRTPIGTVTETDWNDLLDTNLRAPFFCAQRAGLAMQQGDGGVIVNFTDTGVDLAWSGYVPYLISKAGVELMTYGLAKALAPQVRVNGIAPGPVLLEEGHTAEERERFIRNTLLKRLGGVEAVTKAVLYLIQAEFVTGVVLPVDGGQRWKK